MRRSDKIQTINREVAAFFATNPRENRVLAKDLMPQFVKAGIFNKDHKNGLPIRKVLRDLDSDRSLHLIPSVQPERHAANTSWYFVRKGTSAPVQQPSISTPKTPAFVKSSKPKARKDSDEHYVIDLCDEVLGLTASRQHRFPFLLGDLHKNGVTRTKLPCDAYYKDLDLVVEFNERQHTEAVPHFDKPNKMTISGINRGEQRAMYEQRKRDTLPKHGISIVEIDYSDFNHNGQKKIIRNPSADKKVVANKLNSYIPKNKP